MIENESQVRQAQLRAEASRIEAETELAQLKMRQQQELEHMQQLNELELSKAKQLAEIDATKFKNTVDAIGADTIKSMAQAGPEMQAKLLQGLGLQGYLITDGSSPVNLFNTAKGMLGGLSGASSADASGSPVFVPSNG